MTHPTALGPPPLLTGLSLEFQAATSQRPCVRHGCRRRSWHVQHLNTMGCNTIAAHFVSHYGLPPTNALPCFCSRCPISSVCSACAACTFSAILCRQACPAPVWYRSSIICLFSAHVKIYHIRFVRAGAQRGMLLGHCTQLTVRRRCRPWLPGRGASHPHTHCRPAAPPRHCRIIAGDADIP